MMNTKKRWIILSIIFVVIAAIICGLMILYTKIMGSPDCIIAEDYSYLTLYGERYLPLALDKIVCKETDRLIQEAQVENVPFVVKLLFGDSIYSIDKCSDNDIVYLQTEYDDAISRYYCKESEIKRYTEILNKSHYDRYVAEIITYDWDQYDTDFTEDLSNMLICGEYTVSDTDCNFSRSSGDESVVVYSVQTDGPFRKPEGELLRKENEYYWFDYDDIPETQNNGYFGDIMAYRIDDKYDEDLDVVFSYMFK